MKRIRIATLLIVPLIYFSASAVFGQNPHFKRGPNVSTNGETVTVTGALAGLGNGNVRITVEFPNATATTVCTNQGGTEAPGQNPATPVDVVGEGFFPSIKNGSLNFTVTTVAPEDPTAAEAGCPNSKTWTASIDEITFGTGTITVQQQNDQGQFVTVLTQTIPDPGA